MSKAAYEQVHNIAVITIDSPPVNALNQEVLNQLQLIVEEISEEIHVVIIKGAGVKAFVAGADIKEFPGLTPETGEELCLRGQSIFNAIENLKQPVIAAIDGFTLGGGLELALACDIRIATAKSTFGLPEVKLGIIPGYGGTQRLPRLIGTGKALKMILTGETLSAEEAYQIGLVEEVTEIDSYSKALELAKIISSRGPIAIQKAKKAVYEGIEVSLSDGLKYEAQCFGDLCATFDKDEGVRAFLQKRTPVFKGR